MMSFGTVRIDSFNVTLSTTTSTGAAPVAQTPIVGS